MSSALLVPVHLDALYLEGDRLVVEAMADFSRLPYFDGQRDVNSNIANISEEIVSQPLQNQNLYLKAGIHLHWALPDALTKGIQVRDENQQTRTVFPPVPNRWLVTRSSANQPKMQWVVESDYFYPEGQGSEAGSIAYPIHLQSNQSQPFRYLGRKVPLDTWRETETKDKDLLPLTAVGYGEPTFAAFYPNCHSVFGFHDAAEMSSGLQYDIIGWYSKNQWDSLQEDFLEDLRTVLQQQGHATPISNQILIEEEFKWKVKLQDKQSYPEPSNFFFYSRLNFTRAGTVNLDRQAPVEVSVGNTGTEALSAYLGQQIGGNSYKSIIEDQLEALNLSSRLEHRQLDMTAKFKEVRHEKGFNAIAAGTMWTIRSASVDRATADAQKAHTQAQFVLPDQIADLLNALNLKQKEYDCALHEIESMRRQIFADWYKYMLSAYPPEGRQDQYPDIDEVKYYIEGKGGILTLQEKLIETGNLVLTRDQSGITKADALNSSSMSVAFQLAKAIQDLLNSLQKMQRESPVNMHYSLHQTSCPRYWQPKEPVLLITGDAVKPTPRHGQDGCLECQILENGTYPIIDKSTAVRAAQAAQAAQAMNIASRNWDKQPWNPFLLEWEVEVFPRREGSNHITSNGNYDTEFITSNYILKEDNPDLSVRPGREAIGQGANVYSGRSILTPHAGIKLKEQLSVYLRKQILPQYYEGKKIPTDEQCDSYLNTNIQSIKTWYETTNASSLDMPGKKANDPIYTAIQAYQRLLTLNGLSQSLGGFNEALLMHKQTLQLPIAEPLAFAEYQPFAEAVREMVQQSIRSAPEPLNDFNPIRSGAMKILRLRLVDTFGQVKELEVSNIITTEQMMTRGGSGWVNLPPRLVQPARLNFRWLSASRGELEMNSHPARTPICGWILPNNLDHSLAIYDDQGKALGLINQRARWESAPGIDREISAADIPNPYLQRVVNYIVQKGQDFLSKFISALDSGLEHIEPENFAHHQGVALLMGRPIAVVRASLNLELQGLPAINQDWNVFADDLRRDTRKTDGFEQVKIPVRLGESNQFNDGLLGYWLEGKDSLGDVVYASQSDSNIDLTLKDEAKTFTMLIDPRGKVHATCGILPTKAIDIPPAQYQQALEKIEITFLSTPILTHLTDLHEPSGSANSSNQNQKMKLPLPSEAGYEWSWLEKEKSGWVEVPPQNIAQTNPNAVFSGKQVVREGWLKLSPAKNQQNSK
jgi:hypothetical protein